MSSTLCTPGSSTVWSFLCPVSSKNGRDTVPVNDNGGNSQLSPGVPPKRPISTRSKTEGPGGCICTGTCVCVCVCVCVWVCVSLWGACQLFMLITLCTPGSSTVWSFLCAVSSKNGRGTVPVNDNGGNSQLSPWVYTSKAANEYSQQDRETRWVICTRTCVSLWGACHILVQQEKATPLWVHFLTAALSLKGRSFSSLTQVVYPKGHGFPVSTISSL